MDTAKLVERYPRLYHMAEADTWQNIQRHGLLSTTAILDLHSMEGLDRLPYESLHRSEMMTVSTRSAPAMVLRDQKPMSDRRLRMALPADFEPRTWYELLNSRVFFWATEKRLKTLLNARCYRAVCHDVLTIDTAALATDYAERMELCHMNSGNTFPVPHRRDATIFKSVANYPAKANGNPLKEVAEVTIPYSVPNVAQYVLSVHRVRGREVLETIYQT